MDFGIIPKGLEMALREWQGGALVVGLFSTAEDETAHSLRDQLAASFGKEVLDRLEQRQFDGKAGTCLNLERLSGTPSSLIVVGLGDRIGYDLTALRKATALAAKAAAKARALDLGLLLPAEGLEPTAMARAVGEAVRLSLYQDHRFRSEVDPQSQPARVTLIGLPMEAEEGLKGVAATCAGVELARQLVAAPPNVATPQHLADTAATIAADHDLGLKVLERSDCEALGMGAYLAVAQGSPLPPKFIHLTYRPSGAVRRRVVLIGKGLTFDSGGYNLKTGGSQIEMMKYDMGGSAAVLGAARAIAELRPEGVEVHIIVAACENMISGGAVHPGDIVTASNGKTIEINNTDAEGRLTLADALVYACKLEPDAVIDLATLTGACVIALGDEIAGLWSCDTPLAESLCKAGSAGGEDLWRMPLRPSYRAGLKSGVADMKNTGPRPGGSITAALFLQDFIPKGLPWAHLDIAGTVWTDKDRGLDPAGATGFGVRTLVNWVMAEASVKAKA